MKPLRIALLAAFPFAVSIQMVTKDAHAATCDTAANGSQLCSGFIKELYIYGDTGTLRAELRLDSDTAPWGCSLAAGKHWQILSDKENVIRTILSAHLAGKSIVVRAEAGKPTCEVAWVALK